MRALTRVSAVLLTFGSVSSLNAQDLSLDAILDLKVETATKSAQKITEAPAIISVVTADDIAFWGYRSVGEAMETVPGLYDANDGLSHNYGIRGINGGLRASSRIVKVMIDGQPVSFRADTTTFLGPELIPMHAVDRIEIVRGPASALYGANAFLGVINVITKKGKARNKSFEAHANAGVLKGDKGGGLELIGSTGSDAWEAMAAVTFQSYDRSGRELPDSSPNASKFTDQTSESDSSKPRSLIARYQRQLNDSFKLDLLANYNRQDAYGEFLDFGTLSHENHVILENKFARASLGYQVNEKLAINVSVAMSDGKPADDERLSSGSQGSYPRRDVGYTGRDYALELRYALTDKDSLTAGFDANSDDIQLPTIYTVSTSTGDETASSGVQGKKTFANRGYYLQYSGQVSGFGLTLNVRKDDHSIYEDTVNYRVGVVKSVLTGSHFKILGGTSYKAPAAGQLYAQPLYSGEIIGNDELEPESASTIEAEFGHPILPNLMATVSAFHTEVKDKVELVPRGANQKPENIGKQVSNGAEIEVKALIDRHQISGNLSYQNSIDKADEPFIGETETPTAMYPAMISNLAWISKSFDSFQPGLKLKHVTERRATKNNILENRVEPYELDSYFLVGASIFVPLKTATLDQSFNLRIDNLLDKKYADPGFSGVDVPGRRRSLILNYSAAL